MEMTFNDHIKVAQAFTEFPPEAGLDKWPWGLYEIKVDGEFHYRIWDNELAAELMEQTDLIYDSMRKISGWLLVDDFNPWSAAEFLERADYWPNDNSDWVLADYESVDRVHERVGILKNLHHKLAITALGQRAFGLGEYANWTEEQRKPYRDAWERGMDAS